MEKSVVYTIEKWAHSKLLALVEKYNKTAKKLQVEPISFTIVEVTKSVKGKEVEFLEVSFVGAPLIVNGYKFIGTIQHLDGVNLLRAVPGNDIPESYRTASPVCAHCETQRQRKDTFIVQNESGETKMIGRNCLRDFLGHNPAQQLALLDMIRDLFNGERNERYPAMATVSSFLNMTAAIALHSGFSRATPSDAWNYLFPSPDFLKQLREGKFPDIKTSEESKALAERALAWVNATTEGGFLANVKVAANLQGVTHREMVLCGWAVGAYIKNVEKEKMMAIKINDKAAKNAALAGSQHVGTVGQRVEMTLKLILVKRISTQMDECNLYKFVTPEGNVVTWFTGVNLEIKDDETVKVKATIKSFRVYEDIKETAVNRLTVLENEELSQNEAAG